MQSGQMGGQGMMGQSLDKDGCVLTCTATDCAYNRGIECFAPQIRVGEDHPTCDTYEKGMAGSEASNAEGFVANCGVLQCHFNESKQCGARGITVDMHAQHADCATFRP